MKRLSLPTTTATFCFSSANDESHELYSVLEEPEYMDESEEYTLEAALERMVSLAATTISIHQSTSVIGNTTTTTSGAPSPHPNRTNNKNNNHHHHHHHHCNNNNNNNNNDDDTAASTKLSWWRGADETMSAIAQDRIICHECFVCHETVFGLDDAAYLVCPRCYTYCPNYNITTTTGNRIGSAAAEQQQQLVTTTTALFGLALGFDIDTYWECQAEILLGRSSVAP
jgi:hypothetical protein